MEGWRQRRLGCTEKFVERKKIVEKRKKLLTGIGLLMEGLEDYFRVARHPPKICIRFGKSLCLRTGRNTTREHATYFANTVSLCRLKAMWKEGCRNEC
jgi:hypothetical protein